MARRKAHQGANPPLKPAARPDFDFYKRWTEPQDGKWPNFRSTACKLLLDHPDMTYADVARRVKELIGHKTPNLQNLRFFTTHMRQDIKDMGDRIPKEEAERWLEVLRPYRRPSGHHERMRRLRAV